MAGKQLPKDVAAKYTLGRLAPGRYDVAGYGIIDFTTISLADADRLYKAGFSPLKLKPKRKAKRPKEGANTEANGARN